MKSIKKVLRAIAPYGLVELIRERAAKRTRKEGEIQLAAFHAERRRKIAIAHSTQKDVMIHGDDCKQVLSFLMDRKLPEVHLLGGSIPQKSLEYIRARVIEQLDSSRPLFALHIGNFVGVSLAFLASSLVQRQPDSLVVSIDPNLTHRGISNPQGHVSALLAACGVQRNTMIIAGYSGLKSISNDGVAFGDYDPEKEFSKEFACEQSIINLRALCTHSFDIIMMDGNHESSYLANEIQTAIPLLRYGGYVVLDDVDNVWAEIKDIFSKIANFGLIPIGTDGRVGIAQLPKN